MEMKSLEMPGEPETARGSILKSPRERVDADRASRGARSYRRATLLLLGVAACWAACGVAESAPPECALRPAEQEAASRFVEARVRDLRIWNDTPQYAENTVGEVEELRQCVAGVLGSGSEAIAVRFVISYAGSSSATVLAVFSRRPVVLKAWEFAGGTGERFLSLRSFSEGQWEADITSYAEMNPRCCPRIPSISRFSVIGDRLWEQREPIDPFLFQTMDTKTLSLRMKPGRTRMSRSGRLNSVDHPIDPFRFSVRRGQRIELRVRGADGRDVAGRFGVTLLCDAERPHWLVSFSEGRAAWIGVAPENATYYGYVYGHGAGLGSAGTYRLDLEVK